MTSKRPPPQPHPTSEKLINKPLISLNVCKRYMVNKKFKFLNPNVFLLGINKQGGMQLSRLLRELFSLVSIIHYPPPHTFLDVSYKFQALIKVKLFVDGETHDIFLLPGVNP